MILLCESLLSQNCSTDWLIADVNKPAVTNRIVKPGWTIVLDDVFNESTLNSNVWISCHGTIGGSKHDFFIDPINVVVGNGYCNLKTVRINDYRTDPNTGYTGYYMNSGSWILINERYG